MTKRMVAATLSLLGLLVATYLALYKYGVIGQLSCSLGSCETVNTSRYATLLGQPIATWGVLFYVAMLIVSIAGLQDRYAESTGVSQMLAAMAGWGVLFSLYLTGIELFILHAICIWCVTSAVIVLLLFAVCLLDLRERREESLVQ